MSGPYYPRGRHEFWVGEGCDIHPTVELGNPPQHRDWWSDRPVRESRPEHGYGDHFGVHLHDHVRVGAYTVIDGGWKHRTEIGARTWIMCHVHVGHDTVIGEDCVVCPMTSIAGHVTLGNNVRVDQGVTIRPYITVGDGARLGMGAVVVKDVPAGVTVVGNPARTLIRRDDTDSLDLLR